MSIPDRRAAQLREFAGHFPTGVTVVTARDVAGRAHGITVSSVASLSLDPPLFLVCLAHDSRTHAALRASGHFGVHVLAREQAALARAFASRAVDKFARVDHEISPAGCPLLTAALASCECRVESIFPGGDHAIVVGEVLRTRSRPGEPLLYYRGQLDQPGPLPLPSIAKGT